MYIPIQETWKTSRLIFNSLQSDTVWKFYAIPYRSKPQINSIKCKLQASALSAVSTSVFPDRPWLLCGRNTCTCVRYRHNKWERKHKALKIISQTCPCPFPRLFYSMITQLRVLWRKWSTWGVTPQFVSSNSFKFRRVDKEHNVDGAMLVHPVEKVKRWKKCSI